MKYPVVLFAVLAVASALDASPIGKVLEMLGDMSNKIMVEGEKSQKTYEEYSEWCEDKSKDIGFEIKTSQGEIDDLNAAIEDEVAKTTALETKVEDLSAAIAADEADLKSAATIRGKENADFQKEVAELEDTIHSLQLAENALTKQAAHGNVSMMQYNNAKSIVQAFQHMVQASELKTADAARLTALVQSSSDSDDDDDGNVGAPEAPVSEDHTGGIVEVIESLMGKAETQLTDLRKKETDAQSNYDMLKQSLETEIKNANRDMSSAKKHIGESKEHKAAAEGDLEIAKKEVVTEQEALSHLHHDCMSKAQDFEAETKSRGEELAAVSQATKIIKETVGASFEQESFLQFFSHSDGSLASSADLANFEAVRYIRELARKTSDTALTQLASRMAYAMRNSGSADPFGKVRGLITDMIAKLEDDAAKEASEKAYCDKEMSETNAKKDDKTSAIEKLSTKLDQMTSRSAKLKEEVATLQRELAKLASAQGKMDRIRQEEKSDFIEKKADMDKGLNGVKLALKVLREYYAKNDASHSTNSDAAGGVVNLLEVCESDFSKALMEATTAENDAAAVYEDATKEHEMEKMTKEQDVKYKGKEAAQLDKATAEVRSDRSAEQETLDSVLQYLGSIQEKCVAKPESYAERKARREQEMDGLKNAMQILDGEAVLLQRRSHLNLRKSLN